MPVNTRPITNTNLKLAIGVSFVFIGIVTVLLGQILPILSARFDLSDAEAGVFFFAQFSGSLIGTLCAGRLARSLGFRGVLVIGFVLMVVGLPLLNVPVFSINWVAIHLYGMGTGFSIPAGNLLTIEITDRERQAAAVNMINFCWGAGAIVCPPFVAAASWEGSLVAVTATLATLLVVMSIPLAAFPVPSTAEACDPGQTPDSIWRRPASWTFALFSLLIIGIEAGLSGWLTTYSNLLQAEGALAVNAAFVYFSSFVAGRAIASFVAVQLSDNTLISIHAALVIVGVALLAIGSSNTALPGAIVAGLGTSAIFPTHMVRFARIFGPSATRNATPIFVSGILGAAVISWFIGLISTWSGSLRNGIALLLAAAVALALLQALIYRIFNLRPL